METSNRNARPRLGRGLSSLIKSTDTLHQPSHPTATTPYEESAQHALGAEARKVPVKDIAPNPYQPRRHFDQSDLDDLAQSIRQDGVLQPLIITHARGDDGKPYVVVAGERRLRAASQAGLNEVPCLLRQADDRQMLEWAIIENIQRTDLNPIERAIGYREYIDRFDLTQQVTADRLGQPRATIANHLRLLDLHEDTQDLVAEGKLSFGHAKILAGLTSANQQDRQVQLARKCAKEDLSVRQLEELLSKSAAASSLSKPAEPKTHPPYLRDIEERLTNVVGTKVAIQPGRKQHTGKIVLEYYSLEDFDRIAATLGLPETD
jgi:ParB family transcriptional regulator, chromosome partitioning protein